MARWDFKTPGSEFQLRVLAWFAQQTKPASARDAARGLELRSPPVGSVRSLAGFGFLERDDWDTVGNALVRHRITAAGRAALRRATEAKP